jgi:hypothetical protein
VYFLKRIEKDRIYPPEQMVFCMKYECGTTFPQHHLPHYMYYSYIVKYYYNISFLLGKMGSGQTYRRLVQDG